MSGFKFSLLEEDNNNNPKMEVKMSLKDKLLRKKTLESSIGQTTEGALKRCLTAFDLTCFGVGAIIGAGIFVLTGVAARSKAGPGVVFSYAVAGLACVFSALGYAEFAARVPSAGSAYSYAYITVGEFLAWIIGWDLTLEYLIASASVARGWSGYFQSLLQGFGANVPTWLTSIPIGAGWGEGEIVLDPMASVSVLLLTLVVIKGVKESTTFTAVIVIIKVSVVIFVIACGSVFTNTSNWTPFLPFGVKGVASAASIIFFAYLGFDMVVNVAEETKNPQRDIPIGILASLTISTVLYILVAAIITLMVPYQEIDLNAPLAVAFGDHGWKWAQVLISFGSFCGLTSAELSGLAAQPRLYYSMSKDGLLPPWFAKVNSKTQTPINATVLTGVSASIITFFLDIEILADMASIGTLLAFTLVSGCVLTIRYRNPIDNGCVSPKLEKYLTPHPRIDLRNPAKWVVIVIFFAFWASLSISKSWHPALIAIFSFLTIVTSIVFFFFQAVDIPKNFKCPCMPVVPILAIYFNVLLMVNLTLYTWIRLIVWLVIGLAIYFGYSIKHSKLSIINKELENIESVKDEKKDDEKKGDEIEGTEVIGNNNYIEDETGSSSSENSQAIIV